MVVYKVQRPGEGGSERGDLLSNTSSGYTVLAGPKPPYVRLAI